MPFRGLNVQLAMNDVDNAARSLINLGLDQRDLALISGLASNASVEADELHTVSGLVVDQKKELASLARSSTTVGGLLTSLKDIGQPLDFNLEIDNQINAAAIKYNYLDYSNNSIKTADISTSRVSSWSSIGTSILYGGEVEVTGDNVTFNSLGTSTAPIPKTFRAEVATHKLLINVNGTAKEFLAMKGIPLEWEGFFRNVDLSHAVDSVTDSAGIVPPVWRITNKAGGQSYNTGDATGSIGAGVVDSPATYAFRDSSSKARKIEFFYNPLKIKELRLPGCNLTEWTNVGLDNIQRIDINNNDFYELPKFGPSSRGGDGLAVDLKKITISANDMSRAEDASGNQLPANSQLNTLPTTLTHLTMNGVFSDSTTIDLTDYDNLQFLQFQTYYSRNAQRRMTGGTISPKTFIDSANPKVKGIGQYRIYHQPYSQLDAGVCASPNLTYLYFPWCGITTAENRSGGTQPISIASPSIGEFISYGNAHNVVNMSSKAVLTNYIQAYSRPDSSKPRNLAGQFTGCTALDQLYFYASSTIQADIQTAFANQSLSSLRVLDLRWTSVSGELRDNSFAGADALQHIRFAGSGHSGSDFYGTADSQSNGNNGEVFANMSSLQWLYVYNNGNISGDLPDFSNCTNMRGIYIRNTNTSGNLPNLVSNQNLYYLRLDSNAMTGTVPTWSTNALRYVFCYNNQLSGSLPSLNTPYLYYLYLQNNNLSGNLPSMSGAVRLQRLYLNSNSINGYTTDALKYNTSLSIIDLSNNQLPASVGAPLINDLFDNYSGNPRSGVSVNLLGNNGLSRTNIVNDGTEGENSTANKLAFLERFWTILLD